MRYVLLLGLLGLTACSGPNSAAVDACEKAIADKITDKTWQVDRGDMEAKAAKEGEDEIRIQSGITFDPGLPREVKQTFDCRVRVNADGATVLSLSFIW